MESEKKKPQTKPTDRGQTGGGQRVGVEEMGEDSQETQTSSQKISKSWKSNVYHGNYS